MASFLRELFAFVCSQTPDRSWAPGGVLLPFDQRCTGLYVGAAIAVALHLLLRFRPSAPLLWLQGLLLLQMVPLGFHLIPHGPVLRTLSGQLFSFGVVGYLWLWPGSSHWLGGIFGPWRVRTYLLAAGGSLVLVPASAVWGGPMAALTLSWLGFAGLMALGILVLVNLELGYLTPPVGMNLFLALYRFDKPLIQVYRHAVPFLLVLLVVVLLIIYVPALTMGVGGITSPKG